MFVLFSLVVVEFEILYVSSIHIYHTSEPENEHPRQRLVLFVKQVGSDAARCRSVEDCFLARHAAQALFDVLRPFLEHQRPRTVAAATAPSSACLELTQAERQNAELDALIGVHVDLPRTAASAW